MHSLIALSLVLSSVEAICHHGTSLYRRAEAGAPAFGYTGTQGPLAWHNLAAENSACAAGKLQTPISVTETNSRPVAGSTIQFDVQNLPEGELENLGTTLEVRANGSLALGDKAYSLAQFHFHTPSEHRIADEYFPMEVHFVFQAAGKAFRIPPLWVLSLTFNLDR
jgi:carbonic anhydrase